MRSYSILALIALALLASCKKSENIVADYGQGTGWCRLKSMISSSSNSSGSTSTQIQYNSDGRLASVKSGYILRTFSYSNNKIYMAEGDTLGGIMALDTLTYDGSHLTAIDAGGRAGTYHTTLSYNGNGELTYTRSLEYSNVREEFFTWSDGDIISDSMVMNGKKLDVSRFEYYKDKADQYASPISEFLRYGMPLYQTRHLIKTADFGTNNSYTYTYNFDADNKITTSRSVASYRTYDTLTTNYSYECK